MTRDTVAGESPRCSAKNFRLTDAAEASPCGREDEIVFDRAMGCLVDVVCHKQDCGGKRQGDFFSANTTTIFVHVVGHKHGKNRFIIAWC